MSIFDFLQQSGEGSGFLYKSDTKAYGYSATTFTATTGTGTAVMNISAVLTGTVIVGMTLTGGTLSGTRTITSFGTFNGTSGTVNLSGTDTWANPTTVTGKGFIQITDVDFPPVTVRGIVYLDGTYYVMTPNAYIYGSALANPYSWSALNVIQALAEPDLGVALARQLNLIVAFGEYSTEFFYDAANPTGSPLLPYQSAQLEIGCACADSVVNAENMLFFIGKSRQKGPSVYLLDGTKPTKVSNPFIDKILNVDPLTNVKAYYIRTIGHGAYLLTLPTTGITLVYDMDSGLWNKWTQLYSAYSLTLPTSVSYSTGVVTVVMTGHGIEDGDYVIISNNSPSGYNYTGVVNVTDSDTFTYPLSSDPGTYVSGMTVAVYKETFFNMASYTSNGSFDFVQDSTTGTVYTVDTGNYTDNGNPIKYQIQTSKFDSGNNREKYFARAELVGDKISATAYLKYSNDDYQSWSSYRPIDLSAQRSKLDRLGRGRRKAFNIICYSAQPIRQEYLEISTKEGTT